MFDAGTTVEDAALWADAILQRTYRGPGDTIEAASFRAEQKYGVPAYTFWSLRYRRPKDILASIYLRLKAAYDAECGRQEAKLRHDLELVRALPRTADRQALIDAAEAALGIAPDGEAGLEG